jgi:fused signal recognition particle receptor
MGLLDRIRTRLVRTRSALSDGIAGLFRGGRAMDAGLVSELEALLYSADLGPLARDLVLDLERRHRRGEIAGEADVRASLRSSLLERLEAPGPEVQPQVKPWVILVVGVNGSGKTTTIGKLASRWIGEGRKVIVAAGDTYRAAASEQLAIWAQRSGARLVRGEPGGDPAAVAFDALKTARAEASDVLIIDTAGRLQTDQGLMDQLAKIARVVKREIPDAPHETLLVIDGSTGQNAIRQAQEFSRAVPVSGIALTKLDGTAKGGVVLGIAQEVGIPVRWVGLGERIEDLDEFSPESFVRALFASDGD